MSSNDRPQLKHEGTDRERIDAIPRRAVVLGIDAADRPHLFTTGSTYEIWVLNADGTQCVHHVGPTERPPSEWVAFVAEKCGWNVRHRVEAPAGAGLLATTPTPPTRREVLGE